jgi:PAS domain S-box-containing protein
VLLSASEAAPDRYLVLCRDISARKLNEEALRLSEERFRLAMQGANDGLWDWDLGTDHVYYSPRWESMLGYGESEIEPHLDTWRRLAHPDDVGPVLERVRELVEGRSDKYELGFRMLHKDGQYRHILSRAFLMRDASGKGIRLIGTHVDVTERKLAEERIQNLNMLYATLSGVNAAVVHSSNRKELCEHFCRVGSEVGEWAAVWIGFVDRASSRIVPEAWSASMDDHIGRMSVSVDPSVPEGRGPTGTTARTGEPYFCNDVFADSRTLPWRPFLTLFGMQSAAAVPLRRGAEFIGVINIYSRLKNFFTPEVQALPLIFPSHWRESSASSTGAGRKRRSPKARRAIAAWWSSTSPASTSSRAANSSMSTRALPRSSATNPARSPAWMSSGSSPSRTGN